jgi:hypothetical protein
VIGCVFILAGMLFMFGRHIAIGSSQVTIGIVFIIIGGAHSKKAAAGTVGGNSDAPPKA